MKAIRTMNQTMLALMIALSIVSCKKDKTTDPPVAPPVEVKAMTFTELKALSTGASVKVPDGKKITGIVISDAGAKNIDSKTVILQEAADKPGVIVTFDAAQTFAAGDQLEVIVSNQTLAQVNGEVVLQNIPAANAKKTGTGSITAKATTAADIVTNKALWDGTLVTLPVTSLTGGSGKFTGTLTFSDGTTEIKSAVQTGAAFENTAYPPSVSALTGIVRINNNEVRVDIRSAEDVAVGAISRVVTEDWTNLSGNVNQDFATAVGSWYNAYPGLQNYFAFSPTTVKDYGDEGFTVAGKNYLYMLKSSAFIVNYSTGLKGLKKVVITFAASKAFNISAGDFAKLFIQPSGVSGFPVLHPKDILNWQVKSDDITENGKFVTLTWTVPTKEEMIAAGLDNSDYNGFPIDTWLNNPGFSFGNLSQNSNDPNSAPILIEKIEMFY